MDTAIKILQRLGLKAIKNHSGRHEAHAATPEV
jgi:hypothetical protein